MTSVVLEDEGALRATRPDPRREYRSWSPGAAVSVRQQAVIARGDEGLAILDRQPPRPGERRQAWREAMARLRLPLGETPAAEQFEGAVCCLTSPMGMDFALITARAQTICGRNPDQPAAVWLVVLLEGEASCRWARPPLRSSPTISSMARPARRRRCA